MNYDNLDKEYLEIVKDILNNEKFMELRRCEHHGTTRFEHSFKVSYNAYKYAKKHNLDYKEAAVGGLLHDFFLDENYGVKKRLTSTFTHPNKALYNATNVFNVNKKEENIIKCHMFPLNVTIPRYKESWVVSLYDKKIAISEFVWKFGDKLKVVFNLALILSLNFI